MSQEYKINGNTYTQEDIDYVLHLFNSGNEPEAIAEYLDWSWWSVAAILRKFANHRCTI